MVLINKCEVFMMVNIPCLEAMVKNINDSIALFGMYCLCLTNVHRS